MTEKAEEVAQAFVTARRAKRALRAYPGIAPSDMSDAYQIQDIAIELDGRAVAGWKVGKIGSPNAERLGVNRLAGPIFGDSIVTTATGQVPAMPIFTDGFGAVEAEFLLHVSGNWDGKVPARNLDVLPLLDAVNIGIEIASSPYHGINSDGPPVTASDFGNNHGLVLGPVLENWADVDFDSITVRVEIDGVEVGVDSTANMLDGPLGAVRFLLGNLADRGFDNNGGIWVSTGAITGVHDVKPGHSVRAVFEGVGEVCCTIVAARQD